MKKNHTKRQMANRHNSAVGRKVRGHRRMGHDVREGGVRGWGECERGCKRMGWNVRGGV